MMGGETFADAVTRETSREHSRRRDGLCPCGNEPRMAGQAYGHKCRAAYNRDWRARDKKNRETERAELARLRAQLTQETSKGHTDGQSKAKA
jgi:hypothetical protein